MKPTPLAQGERKAAASPSKAISPSHVHTALVPGLSSQVWHFAEFCHLAGWWHYLLQAETLVQMYPLIRSTSLSFSVTSVTAVGTCSSKWVLASLSSIQTPKSELDNSPHPKVLTVQQEHPKSQQGYLGSDAACTKFPNLWILTVWTTPF